MRCKARSTTSRYDRGKCFVFLNNRHYDPTTGVFISVDPMVTLTGQPYIYGAANPIRYSDPDGLEPCPQSGCSAADSGGRLPVARWAIPGQPGRGDASGCSTGSTASYCRTGSSAQSQQNRALNEMQQRNLAHKLRLDPTRVADSINDAETIGGFLPGAGEIIDGKNCLGGDGWSCGAFVVPFVGGKALGKFGRWLSGSAARACSFSAETRVVMADGTTKPISEVEVGDEVLALDPETGERGPRLIEQVFVHDDILVDLSVDGDVVSTTEDHPFWNHTDQAFQGAGDLGVGDLVLTADGDLVPVGGIIAGSDVEGVAYNLAVNEIHTYFVAVGDAEVLVHNTCSRIFSGSGGSIDNISPSDASRIQNAADLIGQPITVVGSRADGTAGAYSDWDFVVEGASGRTRHSVSSSLPTGPAGLGQQRNLDVFTGPLNTDLPFVTFYPSGAG